MTALVVTYFILLAANVATAKGARGRADSVGSSLRLLTVADPSVDWQALALRRAKLMRKLELQRNAARAQVRRLNQRWQPTVNYALRLASLVFAVPYGQMRSVAYCESTLNPAAGNGRQLGLFQLGWAPFGFSPFDPIANALSAAQTVRHDGGWRQWSCKP